MAAAGGNADMNAKASSSVARHRALVALVVTLFFIWGFATVLVDTLVPKLKASFSLSYTEVMLTQFSFFLAYLVVSLPAGALIARIGYIHGIIVGLVLMAVGCVLFVPGRIARHFRRLSAGVVRDGRRHHHFAGLGQSADRHPRRPRNLA